MYITKGQGAFLMLFPIAIYVALYYGFVADNIYMSKLMIMFSIGTFFLWFRQLDEDHELLFLNKRTGGYWEEGYCLDPSIFPFLRNIGIYFPWGLRSTRQTQGSSRHVNIHHYQDQREMAYRINVDTTLMAANTNRAFEGILRWIFGFKEGEAHLLYHRLGFRIILVALIAGWITNFIPKTERAPETRTVVEEGARATTPATPTPPPGNKETSSSNTVRVKILLAKEATPQFPDDSYFKTDIAEGWVFGVVNGRKYFRYLEPTPPKKVPVKGIQESQCVMVPAGREIGFLTESPPRYVINMKNAVYYRKKGEYVTTEDKIGYFLRKLENPETGSHYGKKTWYRLYEEWGHVRTDVPISAQALPLDQIPANQRGGMVCF